MNKSAFISHHYQFNEKQVVATVRLLEEGCTVPFIARYRKEKTGNLDEVAIAEIRDGAEEYDQLLKRKTTVLEAISTEGKLADALKEKIDNCWDKRQLEDIYLPFKQKKQSRAVKAKKAGLEPLAKMIMSQRGEDPTYMAERFVKGEILDEEMALQGARDIMAEWINENEVIRNRFRDTFRRFATVKSTVIVGKEEEGKQYRDYFDHSELLNRMPSHRLYAILRAEREGILKVKTEVDKERLLQFMFRFYVKSQNALGDQVVMACKDAYTRLIVKSIANEIWDEMKEKADLASVKVFAENLRQLLLANPVGAKRTLAIDPGFRTGCKLVVLNEKGQLVHNETIFPHPPQKETSAAKSKIAQLCESYKIEAIAIGDGTAGRETEDLIRHISFKVIPEVYVVREDGASIYSASSVARQEFPNYDVTVRGAISIGRRLMDPLAELVKIDPKSLGVGSYQHEVNPNKLKTALDDTVVSCVNAVGVDVNTASPYLLSYVSGLGKQLAENIVKHREEKGFFTSRVALKEVQRLGEKAYEQAAGFLRVKESDNPLDNSAVHPEQYPVVENMATRLGVNIDQLLGNSTLLEKISKEDHPELDGYTFDDLMKELRKPGLDPRGKSVVFSFDNRLKTIGDLQVGMRLPGMITNITSFGAFVNIGLKENGLIHKSQLAEHYVDDPNAVVKLNQKVEVLVTEVDLDRKRIQLKKLTQHA